MRRRNQRLIVLSVGGAAFAAAIGMAALGLRDAVAFFQTPSEVLEAPPAPGRAVSLGGLVQLGSVRDDGGDLVFRLVDDIAGLDVRYSGPVPDLFREGQCVIAQGMLEPSGDFRARRVLAKHDENYVPREIDDAPRLAASCGGASASAADPEA